MTTLSILSDNIRYLRMQIPELTQSRIAEKLAVTRDSYAKYEMGKTTPPLDVLLAISRFFNVSTDLLLTVDLRKYKLDEILMLPDNRILIPIQVDGAGENSIEIIPHKASMGYLSGYSDPEYIENLQTISLPFLGTGKYRAFPADGDSMPPHKEGTYIIGRYLENFTGLKTGKTYVFITRSEGITYKRLLKMEGEALLVSADNPLYEPYAINFTDIVQVWEYACSIATKEFTSEDFNLDNQTVISMFRELKTEIMALKNNTKKHL